MNKYFSMLVLFLLLVPVMVIGVKPLAVSSPIGTLSIAYPSAQAFKLGTDFDLYFHIFNGTSGAPLSNTSINCSIHIYNELDNKHIVNSSLTYKGNYDFEYEVNSSIFGGVIGFYPYIVYCWDKSFGSGGYVSDELLVTFEGVGDLGRNFGGTAWVFALLPLLFGFLLMKWISTLGDEHNVFKLFLSLLSVGTLFASLWLGTIVINKLELWVTMKDGLASLTLIYGFVYAVMIFYFLIFLIKSIFFGAMKNKDDKMEY